MEVLQHPASHRRCLVFRPPIFAKALVGPGTTAAVVAALAHIPSRRPADKWIEPREDPKKIWKAGVTYQRRT